MPPRILETDLRTLSWVDRWSIMRRIHRQNVAEHGFYVAVYVGQIAELIGWRGNRAELYERALGHDIEESFLGDMIGPVKRKVVDKSALWMHTRLETMKRYGSWVQRVTRCQHMDPEDDDIQRIVKAADRLDWVMYVALELSLGNRSASALWHAALTDAREVWHRLPGDPIMLDSLWKTELLPQMEEVLNSTTPDVTR